MRGDFWFFLYNLMTLDEFKCTLNYTGKTKNHQVYIKLFSKNQKSSSVIKLYSKNQKSSSVH